MINGSRHPCRPARLGAGVYCACQIYLSLLKNRREVTRGGFCFYYFNQNYFFTNLLASGMRSGAARRIEE